MSLRGNLIENGRTSGVYVSRGGSALLFAAAPNTLRGSKLAQIECGGDGRVETRP